MSSVQKKVLIKSEPWYLDSATIQADGYTESPLFGTETTKFYWRADTDGAKYNLYLYLAACREEIVNVKVDLKYGTQEPVNSTYSFNGDLSLDKTLKLGYDRWCSVSYFTCTEITFDETDTPEAGSAVQLKLYEKLSRQLLSLKLNSNSTDITLVTFDKRAFPAHKMILALRSPVFAAMFENGEFKENQTKQVEITDVSGEVMDALLKYVYSANVEGIEKIAGELLQAADKYDLPDLMAVCLQSLLDNLTFETAAKSFYLADLYRLEEAKKTIIRFIGANRKAIRDTEGWTQYIGHEQLAQLYDSML